METRKCRQQETYWLITTLPGLVIQSAGRFTLSRRCSQKQFGNQFNSEATK